MWPDWVSNPGPLTYESGALPTALRRPAQFKGNISLHTGAILTNLQNAPMCYGDIHVYKLQVS